MFQTTNQKQFPWTTVDKYVATSKRPGAKLVATDNNWCQKLTPFSFTLDLTGCFCWSSYQT